MWNDPFQDIVDQKGLLFFCNKISVYFSTISPLPNIGGTGVAPNHPFIDGLSMVFKGQIIHNHPGENRVFREINQPAIGVPP